MRNISLLCMAGPLKGRTFNLRGGPVFIFGRYPKSSFSLAADPAASHLHFLIDTSDNRIRIFDLGSTNGLVINEKHMGGKLGTPFTDYVTLKSGDTILAGACLFRLSVQDSKPDTESGKPEAPPPLGRVVASDAPPVPPVNATAVITRERKPLDTNLTIRVLPEEDPNATVTTGLPDGVLPDVEGFTILEKIGGGGIGVVYKAIANDTGLNAAIKMMRFNRNKSKKQRSLEMFRREIQVTKQLHHPHIIRYLADGISMGSPFLALEYVEGGTLDELIANSPGGHLELVEAIPLFLQLMEAVSYLHGQSLVHRDIKPKNVLLDVRRGGSLAVKLSDLGLASRSSTDNAGDFFPILCEGGTPAYMPPEQLTDLTRAIPQSDVFSSAATFYHMVTGALLYDFKDREHNEAIMEGSIRPIQEIRPDIPAPIAGVIAKALSYEPENRYANAGDMLEAFQAALA